MNAGFDTSLRSYSTGVHPKIKQPWAWSIERNALSLKNRRQLTLYAVATAVSKREAKHSHRVALQ